MQTNDHKIRNYSEVLDKEYGARGTEEIERSKRSHIFQNSQCHGNENCVGSRVKLHPPVSVSPVRKKPVFTDNPPILN